MKAKLIATCVAAWMAAPAAMAADFPSHELTLTVNYGAGSNTDVASRILATGLEKQLGKTVVVENRGGALGTLAVTWLANQEPDAHRIGVVTYATQAISPHLMNISYTMDDFSWVCGFGRYRYGVAVRADSPYHSIEDLLKAAKSEKGVFFGGSSTPNVLALLELGRVTGTKFQEISYKSGAEVATALLGGHVEAIVQNPSDILPHVKSGSMRLLASASPMRWPEAPDVPTLKESGYPVSVDSWLGLAVKAGSDKADVEKLQSACIAAVKDADVSAKIASTGVDPSALTGQQYLDVLREGYKTMGEAIKAANIPRITN